MSQRASDPRRQDRRPVGSGRDRARPADELAQEGSTTGELVPSTRHGTSDVGLLDRVERIEIRVTDAPDACSHAGGSDAPECVVDLLDDGPSIGHRDLDGTE
jgi:hypothetical protein